MAVITRYPIKVTCLGVLLDDEMTFAAHIERLTG